MIIQHNMSALNSLGKLNISTANVKKSSEQLASGFRINCAADDAAGLALSEKMRSQIRGLYQASRNCQDGINLVRTFDGALDESHSIIQRAKELAAEAANGTYDNPTDRAAVELEYKQLCSELNDISNTNFNGICMLNGGGLDSTGSSDLYWAEPTDLKWLEGSFINKTDAPDFNMVITKLPALDEMTMVTESEKEALCELNGAHVSVEMDNGSPTFSFLAPVPKYLSIKTEGIKGRIYMKVDGVSTPVANITLPNTKVKFESNGRGAWQTSTSIVTYNMPQSLSNPGKSLSSTKPSDPSTPGNDVMTNDEKLRREYHDWLKSIPTSSKVQFQVTDDRQHFKIIRGADTLRIKDENGNLISCDENTEYNIGSELFTTTNNKSTNTSGVDYEWENWSFKVSWDSNLVMPGGTISLSSVSCSDYDPSLYFYGTKPPNKPYTPNYYLSLFSISASCQSSSTDPKDDTDHGFWIKHGGYSFTFTYDPVKDNWSAVMNDGRGNSTTYVNDKNKTDDNFDKLAEKLHANISGVTKTIKDARSVGYFTPSGYSDYPVSSYPRANQSTYSFRLDIEEPTTSRVSATAFYSGYVNSALSLGMYDPADPDKGGIEKDSVLSGTFTYVNPDKVNTINKGYWVNQNGDKVDLESLGIHLPKAYSKTVLSSTDPEYRNPYVPLHDGLSFSIDYSMTGATGLAFATISLWDGEEKITGLHNPSTDDLTYADNLTLQTNSRGKDAVNFTFRYSSPGVGELSCDLNCSAQGLGMSDLTLSVQDNANLAIGTIDHALNKVSMVRACFGSIQNRLEKKVEGISVTSENITKSESHIRDTDMAYAMMDLTKAQIVQQAAQSMLAQSNVLSQQVLQIMQ